jgi:hypothetical protein
MTSTPTPAPDRRERAFTDAELNAAYAELRDRADAAAHAATIAARWLARTKGVRARAEHDLSRWSGRDEAPIWPTPRWRLVVDYPASGAPSPWLRSILPYRADGSIALADLAAVRVTVTVGPEVGLPPGTAYPVHVADEGVDPDAVGTAGNPTAPTLGRLDWIADIQGGEDAPVSRDTLRAMFRSLRWLLDDGQYAAVSQIFEWVDVGRAPTVALVGLLRYTWVGRAEVPAWRDLLGRVREELIRRGEKSEQLLVGLL